MIWALLLSGLANSIFGFVVFRHARNRMAGLVFLLLQIASAVWAWGIALFIGSSSVNAAQLFVDSYYLAAIAIASGVLAFTVVDTRSKVNFWVLVGCYLPTLILLVSFMLNPTTPVEVIRASGALTDRVIIHFIPYTIYALTFVFYYGAALVILLRHLLGSIGVERRRLLVVVAGIVITSVFGLTFNLILPWMGQYNLIAIGPLITIIFSVSVAYSIMKYSLFDLRQSFSVSLSYGFSFAIVAIIYSIVIGLTGSLISSLGKDQQLAQIVYILTALLAAIIFQPVHEFFNRVTDSFFFKDDYKTTDVLNELGEVILASDSLDQLLNKSFSVIEGSLKAVVIDFVFADSIVEQRHVVTAIRFDHELVRESRRPADEQVTVIAADNHSSRAMALRSMGIALISTLKTPHGLVGHLVLGEKQSGETYNSKDIETMTLISDTLAVAIENTLRYEEIRHFNDTLRTKVDEATQELRESNKKLKLMDQTKDEFISLTSHQLRTPLTTVKGYLSMLMEGDAGELTAQQRKLVEEAFNSSQRMVHLISDFLNISRIQTGKFVIELSDVNLADVLDEEIDQLRMSASSREIDLSYDKPVNFPNMPMDEGKIRQVMMNFIDNAIYYSPGGTTITIILSHTASEVEFRVIDQGIGVPRAEQHKLFAKFSRASNARKQRPDGTGIGLFMAKKVIVALEGSIIFKSEEGKGSTFGFRLNRPSV